MTLHGGEVPCGLPVCRDTILLVAIGLPLKLESTNSTGRMPDMPFVLRYDSNVCVLMIPTQTKECSSDSEAHLDG